MMVFDHLKIRRYFPWFFPKIMKKREKNDKKGVKNGPFLSKKCHFWNHFLTPFFAEKWSQFSGFLDP